MRHTYNAVFALLFLLLALPALAQEDDATAANKRQLMQFAANNDAFDRVITDTATTLYRRQIIECNAVDQAIRQLPTAYGPVVFPTTSVQKFPPPSTGVWAEHVKIRGCGKIWQINMLAVGQNAGAPLLLALLPGETLSDPATQGNIIHMAAVAIRRADATCADDAKAYYTRLLGYRQPNGAPISKKDAGEGWIEEWLFRFCGKATPVQVAYTPDQAGGFDVKTRILTETQPTNPGSKPAAITQQNTSAPAAPQTQQSPASNPPVSPAD